MKLRLVRLPTVVSVLLGVLCHHAFLCADAPPVAAWLFSGGGVNPDSALALAADAAGNTFVAGTFGAAAKFGGTVLNPSVGVDLLLLRLDAAGKVVWAKDVEPGAPELSPYRLKFDPQGNLVLMAGIPGDGEFGGPLNQLLLAKYSMSGSLIWSRKVKTGFLGSVSGGDLTLDAAGNLYVAGGFTGTADFGGITATSRGGLDVFVAKFAPTGVPLVVRSFGQAGAPNDEAHGIALDAAGNVFVAAQFGGTVQLGATTLTSAGGTDLAIVRYDSGLNLLGARRYGTAGDETAAAMTSDSAGHVYLLGSVAEQIQLGPSLLTPQISGTYFAARLDASGAPIWATLVGPGAYGGYIGTLSGSQGFVTDGVGSLLISGRRYLGKYSPTGVRLWQVGAPDELSGLGVTSLTNIFVAGRFSDTITLDGFSATSAGTSDLWVAKLVLPPLVLPVITVPPAPRSVVVGGTATFSVGVSGTDPFAYQWRKNGADLPGQTAASLVLTGVTQDAAGDYSVVITNSAGFVVSSTAHLTVTLAPPTISVPPTGRTVVAGGNTTFSVTATGAPPLFYQWRHDGQTIPGATFSTYTIMGATAKDAGSYAVAVSNSVDMVTSNPVTLVVQYNPPSIVTPPAGQTLLAGANAAFTVVAGGSLPLEYQWRFNGTPLDDAIHPQLIIPGVTLANAGDYTVVVRNPANAVTSAPAHLTVYLPPLPAPEWQWVTGGGGTGTDGQSALLVDSASNSYVGGYLMGTARFGALTSSSNILGASLIKFDPAGKALWISRAAGGGLACLAFDPAGNILAAGTYTLGDMTISGIKLAAPVPVGDTVMFVAKYTPEGKVLWARRAPRARPVAMAPDGAGGAIIGGNFQGVAQFGNLAVTNANYGDIFVVRCDGDGNFLWARSAKVRDPAASNPNASSLGGLDVDAAGNIWVAGRFTRSLTFGGTPLTNDFPVVASQPGNQMFLARLAADGSLLWQRGSTNPAAVGFATLGVLHGTNALVAGFNGAGALTWGDIALTGTNTFVGRVDGDGSFQWIIPARIPLLRPALNLAVDHAGGAYVLTAVTGDAEFGARLISAGGSGVQRTLLARIEPSGAWGWGRIDGSVGSSTVPGSLTLDATGTPWAAGLYTGNKTVFGAVALTNYPNVSRAELWVARLVTQTVPEPVTLWPQTVPGALRLAWSISGASLLLEAAPSLGGGFTTVRYALQTNLSEQTIFTQLPLDSGQRFFRLRQP